MNSLSNIIFILYLASSIFLILLCFLLLIYKYRENNKKSIYSSDINSKDECNTMIKLNN